MKQLGFKTLQEYFEYLNYMKSKGYKFCFLSGVPDAIRTHDLSLRSYISHNIITCIFSNILYIFYKNDYHLVDYMVTGFYGEYGD